MLRTEDGGQIVPVLPGKIQYAGISANQNCYMR